MEKATPTSIRLEKELYEKVKADAIKEKRSVSKQIEYMLQQYYQLRKIMDK